MLHTHCSTPEGYTAPRLQQTEQSELDRVIEELLYLFSI